MVDTQHFCLRWNNYQSSITSAFENLRDDEDFVDVTLACDGRSLKAHRVVLSACSPYFRELLKVSLHLISRMHQVVATKCRYCKVAHNIIKHLSQVMKPWMCKQTFYRQVKRKRNMQLQKVKAVKK